MKKAWSYGIKEYTFTWDDFALGTAQAPDTDTVIPGDKVDGLFVQGKTTISTNTSTDVDFYLISSPDDSSAGSYDTEKFAAMNLGDGQVKSMIVSGIPGFYKMRANNNNTGSTAKLSAIVKPY
jgi:hypothetical protein